MIFNGFVADMPPAVSFHATGFGNLDGKSFGVSDRIAVPG